MQIDITKYRDLDPGQRILMGPGPSNVPERVLLAMASPCIGHLDPYFLKVMDETQELLRALFKTQNPFTIPVSGTGSAGMETCLVNMIEPGDRVVVCINGVFGTRMADIVNRIGGKLIKVEAEWGKSIDPEDVRRACRGNRVKLIAVVHAETSTGVCQDIRAISEIADESGALLLVDMVTSLGGMDVSLDDWKVDVAYSGTQKCISCPPGLSPISFSQRAMEALNSRKSPVISWYLDMGMVKDYWGAQRKYHHTAPVNMVFALREALRIIFEEGLERRFKRHLINHRALVAGVEAMGLKMLVDEKERLPMLNAIVIPDGVEDLKVRKALLEDFQIEIGGGLGKLAGKIWRVGLMGNTAQRRNVLLFLSALFTILKAEGVGVKDGAMRAAMEVYEREDN